MTTVCVALKKQPVLVTRRVAHQLAKRGLSVGRTFNSDQCCWSAGVHCCRFLRSRLHRRATHDSNSSMSAKGFGCGLASLHGCGDTNALKAPSRGPARTCSNGLYHRHLAPKGSLHPQAAELPADHLYDRWGGQLPRGSHDSFGRGHPRE